MDGVGTVLIEALLLVAVLVLACRWAFGSHGVRRTRARPDYGLLTPVLRTDTERAAREAQERLTAAGIRATVAPAGIGFTATGHAWPATAHVVLVFPPEREAAAAIVAGSSLR